MSPVTKAHIYKVFIRPILFYGLELFVWNATDFNQLKRIEGNIVKRMMGLPTRCYTSNLFESLNLNTTKEHLNEIKMSFYARMYQNQITKSLLIESNKLNTGLGDKSELLKCLMQNCEEESGELVLSDYIDLISMKLSLDKVLVKAKKREPSCPTIIALRNIYKMRNKELIPDKMFELTKFRAVAA